MSTSSLTADQVRRALSIRDLTDPVQGPHAMQELVDACARGLGRLWECKERRCRASPIVSVADNYDRLGYPADGAARDARYTRYVCEVALLRTQTSAMVPPLLRELSPNDACDVLLVCPGLVFRRDSIDRLHTGEPHQLDLWRIRARARAGADAEAGRLGSDDLRDMIAEVVSAVLPGHAWRVTPAAHPYTVEGLQIDVRNGTSWVEIGESGVVHPNLLLASGLREHSGLAMGLGLDRLLMLRKGIDDIRILRATDPRIASQMLDLRPYHPISTMPPIRRDLSVAVDAIVAAEDLGDRVRLALGDRADAVEAVHVLAETPYDALPEAARGRLGLTSQQKNVLLRIVLRDLTRTLTHLEANELRDAIYAAIHEGEKTEWATGGSR